MLFGFYVLGAAITAAMRSGEPVTPQTSAATPAPPPAPSASTMAANAGALISKKLKDAMRDPDSYKLRRALFVDSTNSVCLDYQARNGFGGLNQSHAVIDMKTLTAIDSASSAFTGKWNKVCTHPGEDITDAVQLLSERLH